MTKRHQELPGLVAAMRARDAASYLLWYTLSQLPPGPSLSMNDRLEVTARPGGNWYRCEKHPEDEGSVFRRAAYTRPQVRRGYFYGEGPQPLPGDDSQPSCLTISIGPEGEETLWVVRVADIESIVLLAEPGPQ